jgi:hypothetical protein
MKLSVLKSALAFLIVAGYVLVFPFISLAQVTGTKTIPGNYATIAAAIADVNANGVGGGGVTFNVAAGYTETITTTLSLTATGTLANPIVFQKSGTGVNPLITAYTGGSGTPAKAIQDGIWNLIGSDYVTIDGINLAENAANTTNPATMEYGYGLYKASASDGCQNVTIKNCRISLSRNNNAAGIAPMVDGSVGICVMNALVNAATTNLSILVAAGGNSNNKFYNDSILNCNNGIAMIGFAAAYPYTAADQNNDVGGSSVATGNTILNFGGGSSGVNPSAGIVLKDQWSFNASYNALINNTGTGGNHITTLRGIWVSGANGASGNINNNKVTLKSGGSTAAVTCIENAAGSGGIGNTINLNNNTLTNCTNDALTTGAWAGVWNNAATPANLNMNNNTLSNVSSAATSGLTYPIYNTGNVTSTLNMNGNNVSMNFNGILPYTGVIYGVYNAALSLTSVTVSMSNNSFSNYTYNVTGTSTLYFVLNSGSCLNLTMSNNTWTNLSLNFSGTIAMLQNGGSTQIALNVSNNSIIGGFTRTAAAGAMSCYVAGAGSLPGSTQVFSGNNFSNISAPVAGTGAFTGFSNTDGSAAPYPRKYYFNNTLSNINYNTTAANSYGITTNYMGESGGLGSAVYNNTITNFTTAGGFNGIYFSGANFSPTYPTNVYGNNIHNITSTGAAGTIYSFYMGSSGAGVNIYQNKIYAILANGTSGTVYGIYIPSAFAYNIYNNLIADLKTPNTTNTNSINGIFINTGSTVNVYNNTVYLNATSTGTNFGSSALYANTTPTLTLRNNILINNSIPTGSGLSAAFRRSSTTLTTYSLTSNNNILYAGTPSVSRTIYYDGTNIDSTFALFQTRMGTTRDSLSYTENTALLSTDGTNANFLKPNATIATRVEGGASIITLVSTDYSDAPRPGNIAYTGTAGSPDIGAIEGSYLGYSINMVYDSSNTDQITGSVTPGSTGKQILRVRIYNENSANPLTLTSFKFTTAGTSTPANITNAKLYYTGSNPVFSTTEAYGSTVVAPNGSFYFTGSRKTAAGANYFWLTYDVNASAVPGGVLDATFDSVGFGAARYAPITNTPSGSRDITGVLSGTYNVGTGQTFPTITSAISALTTLGVSGPVKFILTDTLYNTTTGETFPLTLSQYTGASVINTVTFVPIITASTRIVASNATAVVDFNGGATNYILDGRQGGIGGFVPDSNLIILNTNTSAPAIRFINESGNNKIMYCDLQSNNSTATATVGAGVVNFGTTTGANGNDNNILSFCDIHAASGGNPLIGISSIGSTTTFAAYNEGNVVDNCNIYDYFSAATASAGMYVGANNGNWQITNNHIYQTAARVFTSAVAHRALWITPNTAALTSSSGFIITGNYIGGNASNGTGVYTISSAAALNYSFYGMDLSLGIGTTSSVQNNTITNINMTGGTTGIAFYGINIANGNVNIGTSTGNLIGSTTTNAAISFTALSSGSTFAAYRLAGGVNLTMKNNIVSGVDLTGNATTIGLNFNGISMAGGYNVIVDSNDIGSRTLANSIQIVSTSTTAAAVSSVVGIISNPGAIGSHAITNNNIANLANRYGGTVVGSTMRGIHIAPTSTGVFVVSGNKINALTSYAVSSGSASSAALHGIFVNTLTATTITITNNIIHSLVLTGSSLTAAVQSEAIFYQGPATSGNIINRNLIHSLSLTALNPFATISGMDLSVGTVSVANNIVRLGIDSSGSAITTACSIKGINKNATTGPICFNTVYIGGSGVNADANRTYAFVRTGPGTGTDDVVNNVFANNRVNAGPTGGGHFAIGLTGNTALNLNYNIYHAPGSGDTLGLYNGAGAVTMAIWRNKTTLDPNSGMGTPGLVNPAGSSTTLDMHVSGTTPVEGSGIAVSATGTEVDFYGLTRSSLTPIDIGASAGNFTSSDIIAPDISYTPVTNTSAITDRVIAATITDRTGIYMTGAFRPRIYFRKMSTGTYVSSTGVLVSGTTKNSVWNFTISTSAMGGLTANDSVYYYIIAQDSTVSNNITSMPAGVDAVNVNSVVGDPAVPNTYKIQQLIGGSFDVGSGQLYTTLTGANGLFNYINSNIVGSNITVNIVSDISEPGIVGLNQTVESGAGNYRIRVVPDQAIERVLSGSITAGMIRLNGADRVTFDGRFAGSGRYLRFVDTSISGSTITLLNDACKDTFMFCTIQGNNTSTGDFLFGSNATGGSGNDSNVLMNCVLKSINSSNASYCTNTNISSAGALAGSENSENVIMYNEIYGSKYGGINLNSPATGNNWMIYNNYFYEDAFQAPPNADHWIIYVQAGGGHTIRKNSIGGSAIDRSGTAYTLNTTRNLWCIYINNTTSPLSAITVDSNIIGNIALTTASATYGVYGIYMLNGLANIRNNTIGGLTTATDSVFTSYNFYGINTAGGKAVIDRNTIGNLYSRGGLATINTGIYLSGGSSTVTRNTIRDIVSSSSSTATYTQATSGIVISGGTNNVVDSNLVYNITNVNTGTTAVLATAISVTGATTNVISRNRMYAISAWGAGTGANSPQVYGIYNAGSGHVFRNNQIAIGNNTIGETRVFGIQDGATAGTNNYYYNSVYVDGNTSGGINNSYAIQRTGSANVVNWNNIFYNQRTTNGTGFNFATGSLNSIGIVTGTANYNLLVVTDTSKISEFPLGVSYGANAYNTSLYTPFGTYNTNWMETPANIPADSLFIDKSVANLGIKTGQTQCWYVNGKGIAISGENADYNLASARSVTIATGGTDIGSVEFTPGAGILPPYAYADRIPAYNDSTTFYFASRPVAKAKWGAIGSLPSAVDVRYYSGVNPSNTIAGRTFMNAYWNMAASGGSGYTFNLTLMEDSAVLGTVGLPANLSIARYQGTATNWTRYTTSVVNNITGMMSTGSGTNVFGIFTGTDASNNPLPVKLLSFKATVIDEDVMLSWNTASEIDNDGFYAERSVDGKTFTKAGFVKGKGNSSSVSTYRLMDLLPFQKEQSNILYYRLQKADNRGVEVVSDVVSVVRNVQSVSRLEVFPNPLASGDLHVKIVTSDPCMATVQVFDITGKMALKNTASLLKGDNEFALTDAGALRAGIYFMSVEMNGEKQVIKLIKQ